MLSVWFLFCCFASRCFSQKRCSSSIESGSQLHLFTICLIWRYFPLCSRCLNRHLFGLVSRAWLWIEIFWILANGPWLVLLVLLLLYLREKKDRVPSRISLLPDWTVLRVILTAEIFWFDEVSRSNVKSSMVKLLICECKKSFSSFTSQKKRPAGICFR